MNTNRDLWSAADVSMPSGSEVDSAAFHPPVSVGVVTPAPGMRGRIDELKSRAAGKLHALEHRAHHLQHSVADRGALVKSHLTGSLNRSLTTAKTSVRDGVNGGVSTMKSSMHDSPMKWAGIAAGSGLAIGLLGRIVQWRSRQHRHMPQLVIIESSC